MQVLTFGDPGSWDDDSSFASRVRPILRAHRVETSVFGSSLERTLSGATSPPTRWMLVSAGGTVIAAAMQAAGHGLVITPLADDVRDEVAHALAQQLASDIPDLTGVLARRADAAAFAQAWRRQGGGPARVAMADVVYEIDHPPAGPEVPGGGRDSGPADTSLLLAWLTAFNVEAHVTDPGSAAQQAEARLDRGGIMVWEVEGELVSMAGLSGPALGVARVGPVYTPPEHRRQGFGGAITAYAARTGMERGADVCMLYADESNPTSNHVYSQLGFRQTGTSSVLEFALITREPGHA
jgi:GNAT superfamily N-acetyltransferase